RWSFSTAETRGRGDEGTRRQGEAEMIEIAVTGAAGRMGQRLVALAKQSGQFDVIAALERPDHEAIGRDAGEVAGIGPVGVKITADLPAGLTPKVLVDFTAPAATRESLRLCRQRRIAHL